MPTPKPLYTALAHAIDAYHRCGQRHANASQASWAPKHLERAEQLAKQYMPSGSGIDNGTQLDVERSSGDKLVFTTSFHHVDDVGGYDGWTDHEVTVTASLQTAFNLRISGRDRNDVKDYLHQTFDIALRTEVSEYPES